MRETRSHEHSITLDAPPDDVWRAITDAAELTRWFPTLAAVEPGPGGRITYAWPPDFQGTCRITRWEPPHHLRTDWCFRPPGLPDEEWAAVAVDWIIEARGGATTLRVVHSGFGEGVSWDDEYEGTRRGWAFEIAALRHYLTRHRGKPREALWIRRPTTLSAAEAWARIAPALAPLLDGPRLIDEAPHEIAGVVRALDDGLFRAGVERIGGNVAHVFLEVWGVPREVLTRFAESLMYAVD